MHFSNRAYLLQWIKQGYIDPENTRQAFQQTGTLPSDADWSGLLDRLFLWLGVLCITSGIIFFFAYNWNHFGRIGKLLLIQSLLAANALYLLRTDLHSIKGRALNVSLAILIGTLFALIGQIYQTGADSYELFLLWTIAISPLVFISRFSVMWFFWIMLINLSMTLYYNTRFGVFNVVSDPLTLMWLELGLYVIALIIWEFFSYRGVNWLKARWATRIIGLYAGSTATYLAMNEISGIQNSGATGIIAWLALISLLFWFYKNIKFDLFILACCLLSFIINSTVLLGRAMITENPAIFLLISVYVIVVSTAATNYLKKLNREQQHAS